MAMRGETRHCSVESSTMKREKQACLSPGRLVRRPFVPSGMLQIMVDDVAH